MAIVKWEPFGEIDRFFDDFSLSGFSNLGKDMAIDLYEDGDLIVAEMSAPGIDPDNIDITVENGYMRISGVREDVKEEKDKQFYSKEIRRGSFERVVNLPERVDENAVEAEYKDGILKVKMPKLEEKKKEKIKIIKK
jgi:HSP20 family protein